MGSKYLMNKFTSGELGLKFIAEVDYDGYRKAARALRNVLTTPQGGVQRRFGTDYEQVIKNGAAFITDIEQVRLIEFERAGNNFYDIIIRPDAGAVVAFDIYLNGVLQTTIGAPAATYTVPMIREIRWVKGYDSIYILHQSVRPHELYVLSSGIAPFWAITPIPFVWLPTFDFVSTDDPATLPTPGTPYNTSTVTFTPNANHATTVTASIAVFTSNHVNGLLIFDSGIFRITSVNAGGTIATGFSIEDFVSGAVATRGDEVFLYERAWNNGAVIGVAPAGINRGWPSHGTFYQSRLVLGGSPSLPGTAFASVVREFNNFDDSEANPADSWGVEVGVMGNDTITDILSSKSLILIGNKGPASTSILIDTPTTPTNAFVNTQGSEGSRNMDAVIVDNQILYADRAGNTIWSMAYEIPDTGYNIDNASILSAQLIRGPRWADIFDPDNIDGRFYLLVNNDGSMATYNSISAENIKAWTLAQTTGSFIDVGAVANQAKVLTRRKVNTGATVAGLPNAAWTADATFGAFREVTSTINGAGASVFATDLDYLLIGNEIPFTALTIGMSTTASASIAPTFEYLTNTGEWAAFIPTSDTTSGFDVNGTITWNIGLVNNWKSQSASLAGVLNGLPALYWIRIQRHNPGLVTNPVITSALVNTANRIYLEKLDFAVYMDAQITTTSNGAGLVSGVTHLAGQNVFVYANGFPLGTFYVSATGTFTITVFNASVTVGLDYIPIIIPMPVVILMQNGYSVYEPTHVENIYIDFYQSLGITVQGQNLPQVVSGSFMTDLTPIPQTGYYKIPTFGGWDPRQVFTISQSYPAPMMILGLSYTVEVSP